MVSKFDVSLKSPAHQQGIRHIISSRKIGENFTPANKICLPNFIRTLLYGDLILYRINIPTLNFALQGNFSFYEL